MILKQAMLSSALEIDAGERTITSIISTVQPDRRGDVVKPEGLLNAAEFLRNPVVLWAHNRSIPPIGQCIRLEAQGDRMIAQTRFSDGTALARDIFTLYREGTLRGWSIGFVPKSAKPRPRARDEPAGLTFDSWELLEYSAVPIPDNPQALTLAIQKGDISDLGLIDYFRSDVLASLLH